MDFTMLVDEDNQEYISEVRSMLIAGEKSGRSDYSFEKLMQKLGRQLHTPSKP